MKNIKSFFSKIFARKASNDFDNGYKEFLKGEYYFEQREEEKALEHLDRAIQLGYKGDAFITRGMCLQTLNYDYDAIDDFDKAIETEPEDANLYFLRSLSKSNIENYAEAINDIKIAIDLAKISNNTNDIYNKTVTEWGYNSAADMYSIYLMGYESKLENHKKIGDIIEELIKDNPEFEKFKVKRRPKA